MGRASTNVEKQSFGSIDGSDQLPLGIVLGTGQGVVQASKGKVRSLGEQCMGDGPSPRIPDSSSSSANSNEYRRPWRGT